MTLPLTPEILRGAYEYLRATPPFSRWKLPPGSKVRFKVVRGRDAQGWHDVDGDRHIIAISKDHVGHTIRLVTVMAHEMVHVTQHIRGMRRDHGARFDKLGGRVCRYHGFDPKEF